MLHEAIDGEICGLTSLSEPSSLGLTFVGVAGRSSAMAVEMH